MAHGLRGAPRWTLLPLAAFLAVFFIVPMAQVLAAASDGDAWRWLVAPYARGRILTAFLQATLSLALAIVLAAPVAWLHHHWRIPGSRALLAIQAAPFVLPVFVVVGGLRQTLGTDGWVHAATGIDVLAALGPWGAVALANATYNAGLLAILLHATLQRRPRREQEAAAVLGASPRDAWWRVAWPVLRPGMAAAALLVYLFCFASFGVVHLLGGPDIDTLDTLLHANLAGAFPREGRGAALAVVQVAVQAALLLGVLALERGAPRVQPSNLPPARSHPVATGAAVLAASVAACIPIAVLLGAFQVGGDWSLAAWRALAGGPGHLAGFDLAHAVGLSLAYALASSVLALVLCIPLAYAPGRPGRIAQTFAFLPLGTSGVVLGFAFLLAFTGRTWLPLTGNPLGIVAAHTLVALPIMARVVLPALHGIDTRLDDAAAALGAGRRQRAWRLHAPLVAGPVAIGLAFAAAVSLGEYGASLLLMTTDTMSLTVWIDRHGGPGAFDPLARAQSTALAALLLAITLCLMAVGAALRTRWRRPAA